MALAKVCSSRSYSHTFKILSILRHLTTATERLDFPSLYEEQNGNSYNYGNHAVGSLMGQSFNPSEGFGGSPGNDHLTRGVHENRSSSGHGFVESSGGFYWNTDVSGYSFNSERNFSNTGHAGNYHGYGDRNLAWNLSPSCTEETQNSLQHPSRVFEDRSKNNQGNLNGSNDNRSSFCKESTQTMYQSDLTQQNGHSNSVYGYGNGSSWQHSSSVRRENSWGMNNSLHGVNGNMPVQNWGSYYGSSLQMMQNPNMFNSQKQSQLQGSYRPHQGQNAYQFQQAPNGYYTNSNQMYQQQNLQSPSVGQYHGTWNHQSGTMPGSQAPSGPEVRVNSVEAVDYEDPHSKNTTSLEELDAFCKEGKLKEAVEVLGLLANKGFAVDLPRLLNMMQACGEAESLEKAKSVHAHVNNLVSPLDVRTYNMIIEMYSKCGSMDDALSVFNKMPERNIETWDTMIRWLAKNDLGEDAIDMFSRFKEAGNKPNDKIFIGVFSACAVLGDVNEGLLHFESMYKDYGILPSMEHYVGIVDMLGTAGYLDEALEFIEKMPGDPTVAVWETLMHLSRVHGNLELGDRCAEIIEQLDPSRLDDQAKAGLIPLKDSDISKIKQKKMSGQNPLDIRSRVHEYRAGDTSHPENERIYALLKCLKAHMMEMGYIPETRFVLHDVDQESKEEALLAHSERLAFAHGLLTTSARSSIRVIKNLRVCVDCHNALKIICKIVGREFIMRDAKRFHHLKDGICSCRDYW